MILNAVISFLCAQICNAIAGMLNALMDCVGDEVAFGKSIFSNNSIFNPHYWSKYQSAKVNNFLKGTKYRWDAWHNSKSGMIIFDKTDSLLMFFSGFFTGMDVVKNGFTVTNLIVLIFIAAFYSMSGTVRIQSFNLFYNKIFKLKTPQKS